MVLLGKNRLLNLLFLPLFLADFGGQEGKRRGRGKSVLPSWKLIQKLAR